MIAYSISFLTSWKRTYANTIKKANQRSKTQKSQSDHTSIPFPIIDTSFQVPIDSIFVLSREINLGIYIDARIHLDRGGVSTHHQLWII